LTPSSERWVMMPAADVASQVPHAHPSSCPQVGRLIEEDRKARDAALRAEAEKIYEYGQQEDEKRKKARRAALQCPRPCPCADCLPCVPQASKGHWQAAREKKEKEAPPPTPVVNSDEALARIQAATGITRIEDLVEAFVTAEDQSFSMFNFVNELNQEAERLEEQAVVLHQELDKSTGGAEDSVRSRMARVRAICCFGLRLFSAFTD
jgi:hypothetical protein